MSAQRGLADRKEYEAFCRSWYDAVLEETKRWCREEALQKQEGETDFKNAMILVPIAVDSNELIEELKQHFLNRKVRCRKIQDNETGQYSRLYR